MTTLFATVIMAHLQTQATRHHHDERRQWKLRLTRRLYERGYQPKDIQQLFRFIDWLMWLPDNLEDQFEVELQTFEQEHHMPYVTRIERVAEERGLQQGREEGLQAGREEGLAEGQLALILRQLTRRREIAGY